MTLHWPLLGTQQQHQKMMRAVLHLTATQVHLRPLQPLQVQQQWAPRHQQRRPLSLFKYGSSRRGQLLGCHRREPLLQPSRVQHSDSLQHERHQYTGWCCWSSGRRCCCIWGLRQSSLQQKQHEQRQRQREQLKPLCTSHVRSHSILHCQEWSITPSWGSIESRQNGQASYGGSITPTAKGHVCPQQISSQCLTSLNIEFPGHPSTCPLRLSERGTTASALVSLSRCFNGALAPIQLLLYYRESSAHTLEPEVHFFLPIRKRTAARAAQLAYSADCLCSTRLMDAPLSATFFQATALVLARSTLSTELGSSFFAAATCVSRGSLKRFSTQPSTCKSAVKFCEKSTDIFLRGTEGLEESVASETASAARRTTLSDPRSFALALTACARGRMHREALKLLKGAASASRHSCGGLISSAGPLAGMPSIVHPTRKPDPTAVGQDDTETAAAASCAHTPSSSKVLESSEISSKCSTNETRVRAPADLFAQCNSTDVAMVAAACAALCQSAPRIFSSFYTDKGGIGAFFLSRLTEKIEDFAATFNPRSTAGVCYAAAVAGFVPKSLAQHWLRCTLVSVTEALKHGFPAQYDQPQNMQLQEHDSKEESQHELRGQQRRQYSPLQELQVGTSAANIHPSDFNFLWGRSSSSVLNDVIVSSDSSNKSSHSAGGGIRRSPFSYNASGNSNSIGSSNETVSIDLNSSRTVEHHGRNDSSTHGGFAKTPPLQVWLPTVAGSFAKTGVSVPPETLQLLLLRSQQVLHLSSPRQLLPLLHALQKIDCSASYSLLLEALPRLKKLLPSFKPPCYSMCLSVADKAIRARAAHDSGGKKNTSEYPFVNPREQRGHSQAHQNRQQPMHGQQLQLQQHTLEQQRSAAGLSAEMWGGLDMQQCQQRSTQQEASQQKRLLGCLQDLAENYCDSPAQHEACQQKSLRAHLLHLPQHCCSQESMTAASYIQDITTCAAPSTSSDTGTALKHSIQAARPRLSSACDRLTRSPSPPLPSAGSDYSAALPGCDLVDFLPHILSALLRRAQRLSDFDSQSIAMSLSATSGLLLRLVHDSPLHPAGSCYSSTDDEAVESLQLLSEGDASSCCSAAAPTEADAALVRLRQQLLVVSLSLAEEAASRCLSAHNERHQLLLQLLRHASHRQGLDDHFYKEDLVSNRRLSKHEEQHSCGDAVSAIVMQPYKQQGLHKHHLPQQQPLQVPQQQWRVQKLFVPRLFADATSAESQQRHRRSEVPGGLMHQGCQEGRQKATGCPGETKQQPAQGPPEALNVQQHPTQRPPPARLPHCNNMHTAHDPFGSLPVKRHNSYFLNATDVAQVIRALSGLRVATSSGCFVVRQQHARRLQHAQSRQPRPHLKESAGQPLQWWGHPRRQQEQRQQHEKQPLQKVKQRQQQHTQQQQQEGHQQKRQQQQQEQLQLQEQEQQPEEQQHEDLQQEEEQLQERQVPQQSQQARFWCAVAVLCVAARGLLPQLMPREIVMLLRALPPLSARCCDCCLPAGRECLPLAVTSPHISEEKGSGPESQATSDNGCQRCHTGPPPVLLEQQEPELQYVLQQQWLRGQQQLHCVLSLPQCHRAANEAAEQLLSAVYAHLGEARNQQRLTRELWGDDTICSSSNSDVCSRKPKTPSEHAAPHAKVDDDTIGAVGGSGLCDSLHCVPGSSLRNSSTLCSSVNCISSHNSRCIWNEEDSVTASVRPSAVSCAPPLRLSHRSTEEEAVTPRDMRGTLVLHVRHHPSPMCLKSRAGAATAAASADLLWGGMSALDLALVVHAIGSTRWPPEAQSLLLRAETELLRRGLAVLCLRKLTIFVNGCARGNHRLSQTFRAALWLWLQSYAAQQQQSLPTSGASTTAAKASQVPGPGSAIATTAAGEPLKSSTVHTFGGIGQTPHWEISRARPNAGWQEGGGYTGISVKRRSLGMPCLAAEGKGPFAPFKGLSPTHLLSSSDMSYTCRLQSQQTLAIERSVGCGGRQHPGAAGLQNERNGPTRPKDQLQETLLLCTLTHSLIRLDFFADGEDEKKIIDLLLDMQAARMVNLLPASRWWRGSERLLVTMRRSEIPGKVQQRTDVNEDAFQPWKKRVRTNISSSRTGDRITRHNSTKRNSSVGSLYQKVQTVCTNGRIRGSVRCGTDVSSSSDAPFDTVGEGTSVITISAYRNNNRGRLYTHFRRSQCVRMKDCRAQGRRIRHGSRKNTYNIAPNATISTAAITTTATKTTATTTAFATASAGTGTQDWCPCVSAAAAGYPADAGITPAASSRPDSATIISLFANVPAEAAVSTASRRVWAGSSPSEAAVTRADTRRAVAVSNRRNAVRATTSTREMRSAFASYHGSSVAKAPAVHAPPAAAQMRNTAVADAILLARNVSVRCPAAPTGVHETAATIDCKVPVNSVGCLDVGYVDGHLGTAPVPTVSAGNVALIDVDTTPTATVEDPVCRDGAVAVASNACAAQASGQGVGSRKGKTTSVLSDRQQTTCHSKGIASVESNEDVASHCRQTVMEAPGIALQKLEKIPFYFLAQMFVSAALSCSAADMKTQAAGSTICVTAAAAAPRARHVRKTSTSASSLRATTAEVFQRRATATTRLLIIARALLWQLQTFQRRCFLHSRQQWHPREGFYGFRLSERDHQRQQQQPLQVEHFSKQQALERQYFRVEERTWRLLLSGILVVWQYIIGAKERTQCLHLRRYPTVTRPPTAGEAACQPTTSRYAPLSTTHHVAVGKKEKVEQILHAHDNVEEFHMLRALYSLLLALPSDVVAAGSSVNAIATLTGGEGGNPLTRKGTDQTTVAGLKADTTAAAGAAASGAEGGDAATAAKRAAHAAATEAARRETAVPMKTAAASAAATMLKFVEAQPNVAGTPVAAIATPPSQAGAAVGLAAAPAAESNRDVRPSSTQAFVRAAVAALLLHSRLRAQTGVATRSEGKRDTIRRRKLRETNEDDLRHSMGADEGPRQENVAPAAAEDLQPAYKHACMWGKRHWNENTARKVAAATESLQPFNKRPDLRPSGIGRKCTGQPLAAKSTIAATPASLPLVVTGRGRDALDVKKVLVTGDGVTRPTPAAAAIVGSCGVAISAVLQKHRPREERPFTPSFAVASGEAVFPQKNSCATRREHAAVSASRAVKSLREAAGVPTSSSAAFSPEDATLTPLQTSTCMPALLRSSCTTRPASVSCISTPVTDMCMPSTSRESYISTPVRKNCMPIPLADGGKRTSFTDANSPLYGRESQDVCVASQTRRTEDGVECSTDAGQENSPARTTGSLMSIKQPRGEALEAAFTRSQSMRKQHLHRHCHPLAATDDIGIVGSRAYALFEEQPVFLYTVDLLLVPVDPTSCVNVAQKNYEAPYV